MQDTALLLVETQREWLSSEGRLHGLLDSDAVDTTREHLVRLLAAAREARLPIFHAHMRFQPGHAELGHASFGLRRAMKVHDVWSGDGTAPDPALEPLPGEIVLQGRTGSSAFVGSNLDSVLRNNGVRRLIIAGLATHVCVLSTLVNAHDLGYTAIVPHETTLAFTDAQRDLVLQEIAPHFGWIKPLEATLDHLARRAGVASAVERFFEGLAQGSASILRELIDPGFVAEGFVDDGWQRWDRDTYIERAQRLSAMLEHASFDVVGSSLVGECAEVDTRLTWAAGHFQDRLSWFRQSGRWVLRHKGFQFHPANAASHEH